jgi:hypothetical protein
MVPQQEDNKSQLGGLSNIAALAGFNMNLLTSEELPPKIYP